MSRCFWQNQDVFIEPTIDSTPCARKALNPIFDGDRNSHGMWIKPTWWIREERTCYLLMDQKINGYEFQYTTIEKLCCAMVWSAKRLMQYILYYTTWLFSKLDLVKYICEKPYISSQIARWQALLTKYDIVYMTRKAVK